ncbi:hypothetical protein AMTRI_Chr03g49740 [Amborella trichopoda]
MSEGEGTVCVTGAAGFVGSWLVKRLLEEGYVVRATVRDTMNMKKTKHLLDFPKASERLTLWQADLRDEGSFDEAIKGCHGVFHVATPMDLQPKDPENEVIKPAVNGVLSIMRACLKAKTVKRVVFTSSSAAVCIGEQQSDYYDESYWSDIEFCTRSKPNGWMYVVSKTLAEKAAMKFAEENNMDLVTIAPSIVVGPFIVPTMHISILIALALITRDEALYFILKQNWMVHLDDLCNAHIFLMEHPDAKGRYICSSHDFTIIQLSKMMKERYPEYDIPTEFEGVDETVRPIRLPSKRLEDLGFEFKHTMEEMLDGAINSCREKMLMPFTAMERERERERVNDMICYE